MKPEVQSSVFGIVTVDGFITLLLAVIIQVALADMPLRSRPFVIMKSNTTCICIVNNEKVYTSYMFYITVLAAILDLVKHLLYVCVLGITYQIIFFIV